MAADHASIVPKLIGMVETFRQLDPEMPAQTMLTFLVVAESMPEGIIQNDLAQRLGLSTAAAGRNVAVLSDTKALNTPGLGLFDIEVVPEDRRKRRLRLSQKGSKLLDRLSKQID